MSEVIFNYKGVQNIIQCQPDSKMEDICNKYAIKISKDISEVAFLYNGNQLKQDLTFIEQANRIDKERNKISILVTDIYTDSLLPLF